MNRVAPSVLRALDAVRSSSGFPYASNGPLFRDGQFGRDSLETAEDLLDIRPEIARAVLFRLAALQGALQNPVTAEEPGKIHHEYRSLVWPDRVVDANAQEVFRSLARTWHLARSDAEMASLTEIINYYTVDATPLYVRLAGLWCTRFGPSILQETYEPHGSEYQKSTLAASVRAAIGWVAATIEQSDLHLLEWRRRRPWEHRFQAWKDGGTSYLHANGAPANCDGPMASLEVQGLAHDALSTALDLPLGFTTAERQRYARIRDRLTHEVLTRFWMPEHTYFAMAIDRDPISGRPRQLAVLTSNAGALLDSGLFDALPATRRRYLVEHVVSRVMGPDFITAAGIRCTALRHAGLQDYPAYQSSFTVWHKETYDIAKGLRRQGFEALARELERRLLNTVNLAGPREFAYVMPDGRVDYGQRVPDQIREVIASTNVPENDQAWTIAAALAIKWRMGRREPGGCNSGSALEERLLAVCGETEAVRYLADLERARPTEYGFHIDTRAGKERERRWRHEHGL